MHPLLPLYAIFSFSMLAGLNMRHTTESAALRFAAWGAMGVVVFASVFRPLVGDTFRYAITFQYIRLGSLPDAVASESGNWLFTGLNWLLGQMGSNPLWLIAPVTLFCVVSLWLSARKLLSKTHATVVIFLYSVYPYFVFYIASGMKQAIALAFLLFGYIALSRNNKSGWLWIGVAIGFHSGASLVVPFVVLHKLMWNAWFGYSNALRFSVTLFVVSLFASLTGLNEAFLIPLQDYFVVSERYAIYFSDASELSYRSGFRVDFTAFSLLPLIAAVFLRSKGNGLTLGVSGWWLNLYILLACIYQLFAFAPFADRFAVFSWYLTPLILVIMLAEIGRRRELQVTVLLFSIFNVAILQFYTGEALLLWS